MRQQHRYLQGQRLEPEPSRRFWWVLLILLAALGSIYFYVIPLLSSAGVGTGGSSASGGLSASQQRQIAFDLAQTVQNYRHRIHEERRINYGDAYLDATGIPAPFRPPQPFDGMNSPTGAKNDTHSETKLKGWALAVIRKHLQQLPSGSTINVLIFTQVKVCSGCRRDVQTWATQLHLAAPAGVRVNLYIWQQTNFDIDHPDQTPVTSPKEVELAVSASAP
jgi:hypothetical protein